MFTASELAKRNEIPVFTVRHYTNIGLLKPRRNKQNGYKIYQIGDSEKLSFIIAAKNLGFTLTEIKQILDEAEKGKTPCPMVRDIIEKRIAENKRKIKHLQKLQQKMEEAKKTWGKMENSMPDGHSVCSLIETFSK